jgi:putative peptidoglycan lipid II flippase
VLTGITLLIETGILVAWLFAPGDEARRLLLGLTALMLPFMLGICVVALFASVLNCVGSFFPAAITPLILNVVMLVGILILGPAFSGEHIGAVPAEDKASMQIYGVGLSVILAGAAQLVFLTITLRGNGVPLRWNFAPRDPVVRQMMRSMTPVVMGQGILLLGTFIDVTICKLLTHTAERPTTANWFGLSFTYPLDEGALSVLNVSQRLYQFPLGVLAISIAVAALPAFSRLAAREQWPRWATEVRSSFQLSLFVGLIAGGVMVLMPSAIVRMLFEYGRFTPHDTARAARVLAAYGIGMWAFCCQHIVLRGFYSVGDVQTPLKISCVLVPFNIALSLVLVWFDSVREAAFGVATSVTSIINVVVGLAILQHKQKTPLFERTAVSALIRMLLSLAAALIATWSYRTMLAGWRDSTDTHVIIVRSIDVLGALAIGGVVYLAVAALLRLHEPRALISMGRHTRG